MEFISEMKDLNLPIPFLETGGTGKNVFTESKWFPTATKVIDSRLNSVDNIFLKTLNQISNKEFIFLKTSVQNMNLQVNYLNLKMDKIQRLVEQKVRELKKILKSQQEYFSKIVAINEMSINIEAVKTADQISAIQYKINNLQHHKKYNKLSDRLSRARIIPVDTLEEHEIANLIALGLLEEIRFPFSLKKEDRIFTQTNSISADMELKESRYCYSKLGQAFIEACETEKHIHINK